MPKRPPPASTAMPTGQVFRRSQSAKKQKTDGQAGKDKTKKVEAVPSPSKGKAIVGKQGNNGRAKDDKESTAKRSPLVTSTKLPRSTGKEKVSSRVSDNAQRPKHIPRTFRIVVGSYERMLFGFHVKIREEELEELSTDKPSLKAAFQPLFSFAAHTSCISAIAAAGSDSKWLATGAGDESVRVWDLRKRKEVGTLTGHGGTIHSLHFPTRTYLLSSDSSGLINLYRTRDWALLKTLRGHAGRVNACAAHPSGKVALSVGQDGMLRMWDLMRGKGAGAVRLNLGRADGEKADQNDDDDDDDDQNVNRLTYAKVKHEPLDVQWSPSGARFLVFARTEVALYKTDMTKTASVLIRHDNPKQKVNCISWLGDDLILCGTEAGVVDVYAVKGETLRGPVANLVGHGMRVKAIRVVTIKPRPEHEAVRLAITASSDGKLRLFDVSTIDSDNVEAAHEVQPLATHDTGGARLTSLDVVGGAGVRTAAADTVETDVEADMDDEDDGHEDDDDDNDAEMDADDVQELNDLLDTIEEARAQGIEIEGMSDLEGLLGEEDEDEEDLDDDDDFGSQDDGISADSEEEIEEEEEGEGEEEEESS